MILNNFLIFIHIFFRKNDIINIIKLNHLVFFDDIKVYNYFLMNFVDFGPKLIK